MKSNTNRWLYLAGLLLLAVTLACSLTVPNDRSVSEGNPSSGGPAETRTTIEVVAREFEFSLDAEQTGPGTLTFTVRNEGTMPHDFALSGEGVEAKTSMLDPGESETLEVTLEPGTYEYICTVPGHAILGMKGEFTVAP